MRDHERPEATDVRTFLERLAAEARPAGDPRPAVRRARRRVAVTLAGGVLAVALIAAGGASAFEAVRTLERPVPLDSPTPTTPEPLVLTGRFGEDDLRWMTLRTSDRPHGYGLRQEPSYSMYDSSTSVATTLGVPRTELVEAGFVTAYFNGFLSDAWGDTSASPEDRIDLVSYAILFPDAEAARTGRALLTRPTTSDVVNWRSEPIEGLGGDAMGARGLVDGIPTTAVVWRVDNVVLFLASQGYGGAIPLDELLPLAERMNARAA